jgi:hypothetical protein
VLVRVQVGSYGHRNRNAAHPIEAPMTPAVPANWR